jgi:hypothetical protein
VSYDDTIPQGPPTGTIPSETPTTAPAPTTTQAPGPTTGTAVPRPVAAPPTTTAPTAPTEAPADNVISVDDFRLPVTASMYQHLEAVSPADGELGRPVLTRREFANRLKDRMIPPVTVATPFWQMGGDFLKEAVAEQIAKMVAEGIPEDMLSPGAARDIDLRPYLQVIVERESEDAIGHSKAAELLQEQQDRIAEKVQESALAMGYTPEQTTEILSRVLDFESGVAGPSPTAVFDLEETNIENAPQVQIGTDDNGNPIMGPDPGVQSDNFMDYVHQEEENGTTVAVPAAEAWQTAMNTGSDITQLVDAQLQGDPTVDVAITMQGPYTRVKLTPVKAVNYLNDLNEEQLVALQKQMQDAGYFEGIGSDGVQAKPTFGNNWDGPTKMAWLRVLTDSVARDVPVDILLGQEKRRRQEAANPTDRFGLFQPTQARKAANAMAIELVGRELTPQEFHQVATMMQSLRTQRADDIGGRDDLAWQADATMGGFGEADISEAVKDTVGAEAEIEAFRGTMAQVNAKWGLDARDKDSPMPRTPVPENLRDDKYWSTDANG